MSDRPGAFKISPPFSSESDNNNNNNSVKSVLTNHCQIDLAIPSLSHFEVNPAPIDASITFSNIIDA